MAAMGNVLYVPRLVLAICSRHGESPRRNFAPENARLSSNQAPKCAASPVMSIRYTSPTRGEGSALTSEERPQIPRRNASRSAHRPPPWLLRRRSVRAGG